MEKGTHVTQCQLRCVSSKSLFFQEIQIQEIYNRRMNPYLQNGYGDSVTKRRHPIWRKFVVSKYYLSAPCHHWPIPCILLLQKSKGSMQAENSIWKETSFLTNTELDNYLRLLLIPIFVNSAINPMLQPLSVKQTQQRRLILLTKPQEN